MFMTDLRGPKIKLVNEGEKFNKVKLVCPHITFNRLDIKFEKDFELLEIYYKRQIKYVAFHIDKKYKYVYLGLYMVDIDKIIFNAILKFINKKFSIKKFYILQSKNAYGEVDKTIHSLLELPASIELFDARFSGKTRYNRRSEQKKLEQNYNCEFQYLNKENLTEEVLDKFLELKRDGYKDAYKYSSGKDLLGDFFDITDTYILKIDGKIAAINFYSIIDDQDVYFLNTTYDKKYSKFAIGELLYYACIKELIKRGFKRIYLGGGHYDYKKNSKAVVTNTYQGFFTYKTLKDRLLSFGYKEKDGVICKYLYLLGGKFLINKTAANYDFYVKLFKKLKMDEYLKSVADKYKNKKVVIYGAGIISRVLFENYNLSGINITAVCDKKFQNKTGEKFYNRDGIAPEKLKNYDCDVILVCLLRGFGACLEIEELIKNNQNNIIVESLINIL